MDVISRLQDENFQASLIGPMMTGMAALVANQFGTYPGLLVAGLALSLASPIAVFFAPVLSTEKAEITDLANAELVAAGTFYENEVNRIRADADKTIAAIISLADIAASVKAWSTTSCPTPSAEPKAES